MKKLKEPIPKRCKLCNDTNLNKLSLWDYLFNEDVICDACRKRFIKDHRYIYIYDMKIESFYLYSEGFKEAILQYKECFDERLADIFAYKIRKYIYYKYKGYTICIAPSSNSKIKLRGFNHLYKMCESIGLPIMDIFVKDDNYNQFNKSFFEREMIKNHIRLKGNIELPNKILLVDDILTSGATMKKMYNLVKNKGKIIKTLTFSYNNVWQTSKLKL